MQAAGEDTTTAQDTAAAAATVAATVSVTLLVVRVDAGAFLLQQPVIAASFKSVVVVEFLIVGRHIKSHYDNYELQVLWC